MRWHPSDSESCTFEQVSQATNAAIHLLNLVRWLAGGFSRALSVPLEVSVFGFSQPQCTHVGRLIGWRNRTDTLYGATPSRVLRMEDLKRDICQGTIDTKVLCDLLNKTMKGLIDRM